MSINGDVLGCSLKGSQIFYCRPPVIEVICCSTTFFSMDFHRDFLDIFYISLPLFPLSFPLIQATLSRLLRKELPFSYDGQGKMQVLQQI